MGAVYKARQVKLGRIVALKILPPSVGEDPAFAERFTREAQALAKLNHPGIVTLYEFGETNGLYFFLMEFVDGVTLRQLLEGGRVAPREALAIVPQICDALQYAHDQGIVHRDIKPDNILMDRRGRVKVADFGLAKIVGDQSAITERAKGGDAGVSASGGITLTDAGKIMGTPSYMAPEQVETPAEVDHRADIYALGVVLYQMLTGELPDKRLEPPSRKVQIDVRLDEVVLRALEREPGRRYSKASVLKTHIETIASSAGSAGSGTLPPADQPVDKKEIENVIGKLKIPAIGLLISGVITILPVVILFFAVLFSMVTRNGGMSLIWPLLVTPFALGIGGIIIWGAIRMMRLRSYGLCVAAAILAIIIPPGFLLGLIFGTWALIVLCQQSVREAFAQERARRNAEEGQASPETPRYSLVAKAGAICVVIGIVAILILVFVRGWTSLVAISAPAAARSGEPKMAISAIPVLLIVLSQVVGLLSLVASTVLGWIAVVQIALSRGRLRGMGLALFDALFFPLLVLVVAIPVIFSNFSGEVGSTKSGLFSRSTPVAESSQVNESEATRPHKLRSLPTSSVIKAFLEYPEAAWPTIELKDRVEKESLTPEEAEAIVQKSTGRCAVSQITTRLTGSADRNEVPPVLRATVPRLH